MPPFKLTVYQVLIASADLLLVAAVLYVLWPATSPKFSYLQVLGVYMLVFVTGVLTHVPGGYGVMEAVLITIIPDSHARSDVIASWLLFRVIYYIVPLLFSLAAAGLLRVGAALPGPQAGGPGPAAGPAPGGRAVGGNGKQRLPPAAATPSIPDGASVGSGKRGLARRGTRRVPLLACPAVLPATVVRHCWTSQQWHPTRKPDVHTTALHAALRRLAGADRITNFPRSKSNLARLAGTG